MASLNEILTAPGKRQQVVADCIELIEGEVKKKGGLSGAAIKLAFGTVKTIKPGFIRESVDHLLDDFARRLDPFYESYQQAPGKNAGRSLLDHFTGQSGAIADALLGITDERAGR